MSFRYTPFLPEETKARNNNKFTGKSSLLHYISPSLIFRVPDKSHTKAFARIPSKSSIVSRNRPTFLESFKRNPYLTPPRILYRLVILIFLILIPLQFL